MKITQVSFDSGFDVLFRNERAQAAVMVLDAGEATGGPDNRHDTGDQWLFVVSGKGAAVVDGEEHPLAPGTLLLIERGEAHEIRSGAQAKLETLNIYVPPEY